MAHSMDDLLRQVTTSVAAAIGNSSGAAQMTASQILSIKTKCHRGLDVPSFGVDAELPSRCLSRDRKRQPSEGPYF